MEAQDERPGLNFYALRHTFETVAGESKDQVAVDYIMGHAQEDMASKFAIRSVAGGLRKQLPWCAAGYIGEVVPSFSAASAAAGEQEQEPEPTAAPEPRPFAPERRGQVAGRQLAGADPAQHFFCRDSQLPGDMGRPQEHV